MSVQYVADASQKFTDPDVTGEPPAVTVAVNATALPETTVVTGLPPEVAARAITVGTDCAMPLIEPPQGAIKRAARIPSRQRVLICKFNLDILNAGGNEFRLFITHAMEVLVIRPASMKAAQLKLEIGIWKQPGKSSVREA